jgi:hypothetical protein
MSPQSSHPFIHLRAPKRKERLWTAVLADPHNSYPFSQTAPAKQEAKEHLEEALCQTYRGPYDPTMIAFRGEIALIWRVPPEEWLYRIVGHDHSGPVHASTSGYTSCAEAQRHARRHLAQRRWDGKELSSPILELAEDQEMFLHDTRFQFAWKYWRSKGKTGEEAHQLAGPSYTYTQQATLDQAYHGTVTACIEQVLQRYPQAVALLQTAESERCALDLPAGFQDVIALTELMCLSHPKASEEEAHLRYSLTLPSLRSGAVVVGFLTLASSASPLYQLEDWQMFSRE